MTETEFFSRHVFFTTRNFSLLLGRSLDSASHLLRRRQSEKLVEQVTRGLWCQTRHPDFTPYAAVPHLLGLEQGYVSFLSALHRHGVLSQIPGRIQVATTGRGRILSSPIATFEFFQLKAELIRAGTENAGAKLPYRIASREKALLDTLYLSTRKGRRFAKLPELEIIEIDRKALKRLLALYPPTVRKIMEWKLKRLGLRGYLDIG